MATALEVKNKMLEKLAAMDLEHMNLMEAGQYAMVLRTLSEINDKDYMNELLHTLQDAVHKDPGESMLPICMAMASGGE